MFSIDELYRYELRREWDRKRPPFICIMLNPSTADEYRNDPTIARVIRRAATLGFGSVIIGNIAAYRATFPRDMLAAADPIGPSNKRRLGAIMREARERRGQVMVGWGNHAKPQWVREVVRIAVHVGVKLYCLGVTKDGNPLHPLHVAYSVKLRRWSCNVSL